MTYACLGEPQKSHHTSVRSKIRAPPHRCLGFVCRRQIQQLSCGCAFETWVSNTRLIKYELETYYRCFFCGGGPKIRAPPHCSSGPSLRTSQYYVSLADKAGNICDTGALRLQIQLHGERLIYTYQRTTLPPIQQKSRVASSADPCKLPSRSSVFLCLGLTCTRCLVSSLWRCLALCVYWTVLDASQLPRWHSSPRDSSTTRCLSPICLRNYHVPFGLSVLRDYR